MKKVKKQKMTTEEILQKREKTAFKRKIWNAFVGAGFEYIPSNDHQLHVGYRDLEIDSIFVYENVWLICEDTIGKQSSSHIRTKNEVLHVIRNYLKCFIEQLCECCPDKKELITKYDIGRIKIYGLYLSKQELVLSEDDLKLFSDLIFVQPKTLNYFQWLVKCIKLSARYEIFRFLKIRADQIGNVSSTSSNTAITAPIIYPKEFTGFTGDKNRVRLVSFMMSAEELLSTCYVLRKDNWEDSIWLYQRLVEKGKVKKIREFIETKGEAFYNNIIVALPDNVKFQDSTGNYLNVEDLSGLDENCKLIIPKEMNSICVIDGQHRIYAHYESGSDSKQERRIAELRKKLHLLVTGLVFPKDMDQKDRARIQSEIFLDINSNAKPVSQNILLQIKRIKNPIADESIAQFIVEQLNKTGLFQNLFQISSLDNSKIKVASIVRFALRYLVTVTPAEGKHSLFEYWNGDKEALKNEDEQALKTYVTYCASVLSTYFGALKKNLRTEWEDPDSKILSVISINGFIIALTRQLGINGVRDFEYYDHLFSDWKYDFSKDGFPYTSSRYRKFSNDILKEVFHLPDDVIETI